MELTTERVELARTGHEHAVQTARDLFELAVQNLPERYLRAFNGLVAAAYDRLLGLHQREVPE